MHPVCHITPSRDFPLDWFILLEWKISETVMKYESRKNSSYLLDHVYRQVEFKNLERQGFELFSYSYIPRLENL